MPAPAIKYFVLAVISLTCLSVDGTELPDVKLFSGMSFVSRDDILVYHSTIPLSLNIPINLQSAFNYTNNVNAQCLVKNDSTECKLEEELRKIKLHLVNQLKVAQHSFLQNDDFNYHRNRRGILFLGKLMNLCCNLITTTMFEKSLANEKHLNYNLNKVLNFSRQNSNNTNLLKEHFDSFSVQVKKISDRVNSNLLNLQEQILNITLFPDLSRNLFAEIGDLWQTILLLSQNGNLNKVKNLCHLKLLSKEIVPSHLLRDELNPINLHLLENNFTLAINPLKEIELYYNLPLVKCVWSKDDINLRIMLPIIRKGFEYVTFNNFPTHLQWENKICTFTNDRFLIIKSQDYINVIPSDDEHCSVNTFPLCKISRVNHHFIPQHRCVISLFKNLTLNNIKQNCQMTCQEANLDTLISRIDHHRFYITNHAHDLKIICQNETLNRIIRPITVGVLDLQIPCSCELINHLNETLIDKIYPCDGETFSFDPVLHRLLPQIWSAYQDLHISELHKELTHRTKYSNEILNELWPLNLSTFTLQDKVKITESNFDLKFKGGEVMKDDSLLLYALIIWNVVITILILAIIFCLAILHFKTQLLIKNDAKVEFPPPIPHRRVQSNATSANDTQE